MNLTKLVLLTIVLNYLEPAWHWDINFVLPFASSLTGIIQSQELIWFISQNMETKHMEKLDEFTKRLHDAGGISQYVWTNRTDLRIMNSDSKRNYMGLVICTGPEDPIMEVHNKILLGRHYYFSLIVLVPKVSLSHFDPVERLCWYLYRGNFVNSIIYFQTVDGLNLIYGYSLFPEYKVQNRTNFQEFMMEYYKKVMSATQDVAGYRFRTPLRQDMPRVFKYVDSQGHKQVQGTSYRIIQTFVDMLNGSLLEYEMERDENGNEIVDMKAVLNLVRTKELDFAAHAYALFKSDDQIDMSYPIMVVKWCLMVPVRNSVSTFFYPLQPFDELVWLFVIAVLLSLLIMDFFWIVWQSQLSREHWRMLPQLRTAFLNNFCFVINIAAAKNISTPSNWRFFVYATIFFHGFFLAANYTSLLGSFLAVTLFRTQINTLEDIVLAKLPVMIIDYELEFLLAEGYIPSPDFAKLLLSVNTATYHRNQGLFNTSYAYFITEDKWHFLEQKQKHLKQGIFKFTDICFGSYHLGYPMQVDSPVWRDLEYYLFRVHSSGLLGFYESTAFEYAVNAGYMRRLLETNEYTSAGIQHLLLVFYILGVMYTFSGICFIGELMWHHWKQYKVLYF